MSIKDSSTGGYIQPAAPPGPTPLEDQALEDFLQAVVVGVTGLPGPNVRPRWQLEPPNLPPVGADWAAIGIINQRKPGYAAVIHNGGHDTVPGSDTLQRQQELDIMCSFYGPNAGKYAGLWSDGLCIPQNREQLQLAGFGIDGPPGEPLSVPVLMREQWLKRIDVPVTFVRMVVRTYPVLDLASASGTVITDAVPTAVQVNFTN